MYSVLCPLHNTFFFFFTKGLLSSFYITFSQFDDFVEWHKSTLGHSKWDYRIARKFCGVKFSQKLIWLSFRDFIFMDSDPIAIINGVNVVSRIKIFVGRDKSAKNLKNLTRETF